MVKETLSPDEVAAMLTGRPAPVRPLQAPTAPVADWKPSYDRCDRCNATMACLMTFRGNSDWSDWIELEGPVRDAVSSLRHTAGRRTIVLCGPCLTELRAETPAVPNTAEQLSFGID